MSGQSALGIPCIEPAHLRSDSAELSKLAKENPALVLAADDRRRLYFLEQLSSEQKNAIDQQWLTIKQAVHPLPAGAAE